MVIKSHFGKNMKKTSICVNQKMKYIFKDIHFNEEDSCFNMSTKDRLSHFLEIFTKVLAE